MPSPLAHASLAFFARPAVGTARFDAMTSRQRWTFRVAILFALLAPDADFAFRLVTTDAPALAHGGALHSLAAALVFGLIFAVVVGAVLRVPVPLGRLALVGGIACASHVVFDACTWGSGVMAAWPFSSERVGLPWPLFFGVRHSHPYAIHLHLVTIVTELLFAAAVWTVSRSCFPSRWGARVHGPDGGVTGK